MADPSKRAGWYPDPDGAGGERWWSGAGWSDSRRGGAVASVPAVAAVASVAEVATSAIQAPPPPPAAAPLPPVVYSASNPAPQRPDPYGQARVIDLRNTVLSTAPGRTIDARVNKHAFYGFVAGLISLFFNLFFAVSIVAIIFSGMGIARARQLQAQGAPSTLMGIAVAGLAMGALSTLIAISGFVMFVVSVFATSVS